ncbi:MAG TPA: GDSL-type esterase/lipase family protein [Xanthobacteraceae bacterium]|nr:GDSL-type esterase/lipase family protein [Xanthobacteraceae bacterium]
MKLITAALATIALIAAGPSGAAQAAPPEQCDAPQSLIDGSIDLSRVMTAFRVNRRLTITVIGSGSSGLSGPDGAHAAYPARLEAALKQGMPGVDIKVAAHVQSKETTAAMVAGLDKILADDKPTLVIWQAGTVDALDGVEPDDFRNSLNDGVDKIQAAGADVILMNMQYSPRMESMLDVSPYADVMRAIAEQHGALLFDRLAIMRYWNDAGSFDLYAATKKYDMARRVHDCIGWVLASQILAAAHLDATRIQTTQ